MLFFKWQVLAKLDYFEIIILMMARSEDTNLSLVLIVRFTYFISVVLERIRSYPYEYCTL